MSNPFTTKDPLVDIIKQVVLGEKKLTDAELKKREEIVLAIKRENPDMEKSRAYAIATAQAKKVAEEVNLQEITTKSGADVDRNLDDHDPEEHGDIPDRKPDHELETHGGTTLHVHHVKDSKGKTTHTIINHVHDPAGGGTFVVKGHAHPKHILSSYNRAEREDMYESVNLDEQLENFWEAYTTMFNEAEDQQQNILLRAMAKDSSDLMKMKRAIKMGDKALTNPALRQEILTMLDKMMHLTTGDPSLLQRTKAGFQKAKKLKMPEEVEMHEDDLSVRTLYDKYADRTANAKNTKPVEKAIKKVHGSGVLSNLKKAASANFDTNFSKEKQHFDKARKAAGKTDMIGATVGKNRSAFRKQYEEVQLEAIGAKDKQDEGEYGYEGDMAMSQLRTIIRNCQEMMKVLDKETDMPEWVQSKITLATDYLQTANDYLMSELEEAANPAQQAAIAIAMKKAGKKPKNEEVEKAPFDGGQVKPRRTDAEIAKAVSALAKKARSVQKQKNKKDKM